MRNALQAGSRMTIPVLLLALAFAGQLMSATIEPGEKTLQLKASNFKFEPNSFQARKGDVLTIKVENISGSRHNLTVKSPQGIVLADLDIPPHGSAAAEVKLAETGIYPFYCNKFLHSTMGMEGRIEVSP